MSKRQINGGFYVRANWLSYCWWFLADTRDYQSTHSTLWKKANRGIMLNFTFKLCVVAWRRSEKMENRRTWLLKHRTENRPQVWGRWCPESVQDVSDTKQGNEDAHKLNFTPSKLFWCSRSPDDEDPRLACENACERVFLLRFNILFIQLRLC